MLGSSLLRLRWRVWDHTSPRQEDLGSSDGFDLLLLSWEPLTHGQHCSAHIRLGSSGQCLEEIKPRPSNENESSLFLSAIKRGREADSALDQLAHNSRINSYSLYCHD